MPDAPVSHPDEPEDLYLLYRRRTEADLAALLAIPDTPPEMEVLLREECEVESRADFESRLRSMSPDERREYLAYLRTDAGPAANDPNDPPLTEPASVPSSARGHRGDRPGSLLAEWLDKRTPPRGGRGR